MEIFNRHEKYNKGDKYQIIKQIERIGKGIIIGKTEQYNNKIKMIGTVMNKNEK